MRAGDIDVIWVYGYGFPAWRGGPMYYADQVGLPYIRDRLTEFARITGDKKLEPAPLLVKLASEGKGFGSLQRKGLTMLASSTPRAQELAKRLTAFMEEHVYPSETVFELQLREASDRWEELPVTAGLKAKAKAAKLWNLWLPKAHYEEGLSNLDYAPLCEIMGRSPIGPESFNCSAPDTGNMETLILYGNAEQKRRWLPPLMDGEIRSCFAMTEPEVASSDATNIRTDIARDGDSFVINGRKWWTTGAPDKRAKIAIVMGPHRSFRAPHIGSNRWCWCRWIRRREGGPSALGVRL